jgi:cysteine desulfurase/selenocysteine lyase
MCSGRTKLIVFQHISNVLGNVNDIRLLSEIADENGAKIVIDGAASTVHGPIDLNDVDCDFFVTSRHTAFGPNGSGFMFGKYDLLKSMPHFAPGTRCPLGVLHTSCHPSDLKPP